MEFRLLYDGELRPTANKSHPEETHKARRAFHPQLRRLWNMNHSLRQLAAQKALHAYADKPNFPSHEEARVQLGFKAIGENWNRANFDFVPLVTPELVLRCSFDILLLRPEEQRFIFKQGDIDGQLKALIDALRMPKDAKEAGGIGPQDDEHPFFCLLENDNLITEVKVTSDQLLLLPHEKTLKANDVFAVIHVRLNHRNARTFDNYFG